VIPIVGAHREEQIAENLGALEVALDSEAVERLDEATRPRLGFPRDFLESGGVRSLIYGKTYERIRAVR
jgi:diketogulonate reductase-like aldo/keto reductase